jgi:triphosphoribosyl-dephospho-CoA synthase
VAAAAQLACLLEASAPKPGNVSPRRHFGDTRYEDFLASAAAIGGPVAGAGTRPLGATIRLMVEATSRWTDSNTNLGIVLLFAPLAQVALTEGPAGATVPPRPALRDRLRRALEATSVADACDAYAAIRRAGPGGLDRVETQDVGSEPTMTLLDVMRLARDRDGIAREYATAFETTFETGAPVLDRARGDGLSWDAAVVETFLTLLALAPDTHVARRAGEAAAEEVSRRARTALATGGVRSRAGLRAIRQMDRDLRDPHHANNPGTTADLTAAAIFLVLLDSPWRRARGGFNAETR